MNAHCAGKSAWLALLFATTIATHATAETNIRFTLDFKIEGPSAPFLVPLDKGYYSAEGLNVTIDPGLGSLQPIERVASGEYDMGFGDINALIRFRDANPTAPVKAVFMLYNRPPYAVIGRKSRGISSPKDLEGKTLGAPSAGGAFAEWPIFAQANNIDVSKVAIENVSFPVREPMLAAGQVDAITGYSFTSYVNLKDKGVPVDDIVVLLMADYGVVALRQRHSGQFEIRRRASRCSAGFPTRLLERPEGHGEAARGRDRVGHQAQRTTREKRRA